MIDGTFRAYYVWPDFPSISLSGDKCGLRCRHCAAVYLKDMHPAVTPEALVTLCEELKNKGARGVLLSGGCDAKGRMLSLPKFLGAISEVHDMGLIIKLHTGLVDRDLGEGIASTGVDIASMEMVGDDATIEHVFGIDAKVEDFAKSFRELDKAGVPHICPHVCVGLHDGKLMGEFNALKILADTINPTSLAIIVLRPTHGTVLKDIAPPSGGDVNKVVKRARELFPATKIILGALRPRGSESAGSKRSRLDIEMGALDGGIDGAEVPSETMLAVVASQGIAIKKIQAYGVLPVEYEDRVRIGVQASKSSHSLPVQ